MIAPGSSSASRPAQEDFAATLARFACALTIDELAPPVRDAVKANLFDTLACAAAGSSAAGVTELLALAREWAGAPQASILVFGDALPAHHAALVNGTMAHARDYDDTHDAATLHGGVSVVPAAMAAAGLRGGVPGRDLAAAVAAGLETICRLGVSTTIGIVDSGYMYTALFGYFAATVAAGRVLGLDEQQMVNALGIVYSQAAGNHQVSRDGALTKRMQPGFAAMSGVLSAQMARRGIRGVQSTFEGADGLLRVYLHDHCDRERLRDGLGQRFELLGLSYKPYPCCRFSHTAIDAARELRARVGPVAKRVRRIRVGINRLAYEVVCTPVDVRKAPATIVEAQFSIPYAVATALVDGTVELGHFSEAALGRRDIMALAGRVEAYVDQDLEREWGRKTSPALLTMELDDGTIHRARADWALGHPNNPMSTDAFDAKALDCMRAAAVALGPAHVQALRQRVDSLETLVDARAIAEALTPAR
ncbi:MAG: MmgE/PrpD family protein [Burkholderiales bacterium]|nr:MmgE/PrpD family protein [Burkholderiales bacterium]